jgi:hypothetical protein
MRSPYHVPFSQHIIESFPSCIWFSIISVKDVVRKLCLCKRQMQVCKSSASINFSLEAWTYLCRFLQPIRFSRCITKPHQYLDLSLQSKSSINFFSMIRILNTHLMVVAQELFGKTFSIRTHNIPPCKFMLWKFWKEMMSQI